MAVFLNSFLQIANLRQKTVNFLSLSGRLVHLMVSKLLKGGSTGPCQITANIYLVGELVVEIFDLTVGLGQVQHGVRLQLLLLLLALVGGVRHLEGK